MGGSTGYDPMASGGEGAMPGDPMGYPPGYGGSDSTGYPGASGTGYPGSDGTGYPGSSDTGYPGAEGTTPGYPPGYDPSGAGLGPEGYPGAGGAYGRPAPPPKPKTIRDKALAAFREGNEDEGFELFAAHYLTTPSAGPNLARNMQWSPGLRRPTLATRFGVAIVYTPQTLNWDGHPQPLGSPELEAALGELDKQNTGGEKKKASRKIGANRKKNREGNRQGGAAPMNPGASGEFGPGYGPGNQQEPASPKEEFEYFTGEIGTKLLARMKAKMEASTFGSILRDANKAMPVVAEKPAGAGGEGFAGMGAAGMGAAGMRGSGPGDFSMPGAEGSGEIGPDGRPVGGGAAGSGELTGQLLPGVTFLGAVENVKELGEVVKTYPEIDVVFIFDVQVRATAGNWVNNNTRLRIAPAAKVTEALYTSPTINNKAVYEARKKKGEEDLVAKVLNEAIAALENGTAKSQPYKLQPLPAAVTPEVALKRINALAAANPESAVPMLIEARFYVAKKLLKPEEMMNVVLTAVTEDQLAGVGELLEGEDVKEKIGVALQGGERPKTVLGRFGDALAGAGGLSNLVPTPELPPISLPGAMPALGPAGAPGGVPAVGPNGQPGAGNRPMGSRPPMGFSTGGNEGP